MRGATPSPRHEAQHEWSGRTLRVHDDAQRIADGFGVMTEQAPASQIGPSVRPSSANFGPVGPGKTTSARSGPTKPVHGPMGADTLTRFCEMQQGHDLANDATHFVNNAILKR